MPATAPDAPAGFGEDRMRRLLHALTISLPRDGRTVELAVGLHWTGVVVERHGRRQCGLASTVAGRHPHGEVNDVEAAGHLRSRAPDELVELIHSSSPTERGVGLAAINALLVHDRETWREINAAEVIARKGKDRDVALVGHFPFIPSVQERVGHLFVIEQDPMPGELSPEAGREVLPTCSVVAITSMTLINGTFGKLMEAVAPEAYLLLLGPSSPLSPVCFDHGVDLVAGTEVVNIPAVMQAVREGANYRQLHRLGTRLVTVTPPGGDR